MTSQHYFFWKPGSTCSRPEREIYQELSFGEDVEGLIDLPIHEVIARVKEAFAGCQETTGQLAGRGATGEFALTWTWQFVRVESQDMVAEDLRQLFAVLRGFGCGVYDAQSQAWSPPEA